VFFFSIFVRKFQNFIDFFFLLSNQRNLILIPERSHIVSVSWDKTIKIWRSYKKQIARRAKRENESEKKFDNWVLDEMKEALKCESSFDLSIYSKYL
jgi:5-formaminoimidazole-4-carboxamide-1-beta-D-ribofuranosyl 5'-monophosphate synthetase